MKFYSIRVVFVLQVVWMIMMSSCEKNQNVYSQPTDIPDNPSSVDALSDKYASREITLELKENVPNSDGCIYFSFTSGKISGKSTSDAADSREWDIAFDKVNGFTNGERKGNASVSVYVTDYQDFDSVVSYRPFVDFPSQWQGNDNIEVMLFDAMPPRKAVAYFNAGICNYYTFDMASMPPAVTLDNRIRIIKTVSGEYVKLQFIGVYKDAQAKTGFGTVSFRYAFLKAEGTNGLRTGEVLVEHLEQGTLKKRLESYHPEEIRILTIQGILDQTDVNAIKEIRNLDVLDLSNASLAVTPHQYFLRDNSSALRKVILPSNLENIGQGWLGYCSSLQEVVVPGNTLKGIMDGAFAFTPSLEKVTLPESVLTVSHEAFAYSGIREFVYPPSVQDVEYKTFYACKQLEKITLPSGVKTIQGGALAYCSKLTDIHLPGMIPPVLDNTYYEIRGSKGSLYPFAGLNWYNENDEILVHFYVPRGTLASYISTWHWEDYTEYLVEQ